MRSKTQLIFEQSQPGRTGSLLPGTEVPEVDIQSILGSDILRELPAELPQVSEPEIVRHFTNLSTKNHHIDKDFYPLGSCTMKYNPKINEIIAGLPGFVGLHPKQSDDCVQGALQIFWELEVMLKKMTGMAGVTLQPVAGAQGEFTGALVMKKYHEFTGRPRKYILIPETAHGTNPASVILSGYQTRVVASDSRGRVNIEDLKSKTDEEVAGMMLTQPNTLGLFEDNIAEICSIVHEVDGLMYMDGANLNALVGLSMPAKMGFDITHINLHKTFATPHGGGGPGAGPIGVVDKLLPYLPTPVIRRDDIGRFYRDYNLPHSVGPVHTYFGNFLILVRAWSYIKSLGESGVKEMSHRAIVNANYLKARLQSVYDIPFTEGTMHEFVISGVKQKARGIKVLDIAKALLDKGYHAPTIYFPINIPESMMIEPTESETKETMDHFTDAMLEIDSRIDTDPESLREAPITTPVKRLDETLANRQPNVRWTP